MKHGLVFTVGNRLMGDDAAGPLLAERLLRDPLPAWDVLDGGSAPENLLHVVRGLAPQRLLLVDAADMDLAPGELRFIEGGKLEDPFLMTTHTLPLSYLVQALEEFVPRVDLLGIQPDLVAFGYPVSPAVMDAVERLYTSLSQGDLAWHHLPLPSEATGENH